MGDLSMGIMSFINLVAIVLLCPLVFMLLKDYSAQLRAGSKDPAFKLAEHPQFKDRVPQADIW